MKTTRSGKRGVRRSRRLGLGDRVVYYIGPQRWLAEVIEDRGKLGVGGTRIYRIRSLSRSPGSDHAFEMPEDLLKLVRRKTSANGKS